MPWRPLPQIAFGIARCPFTPEESTDLPLELGDELYIIEEGGRNQAWFRGYLVAPPSLLAGLTSVKGQALEARVFSGIFPRNCVEIKEYLGDNETSEARSQGRSRAASESRQSLSEKKHDSSQNSAFPLRKDSLKGGQLGGSRHQRQASKASQRSLGAPIPIVPTIGPDGKRVRPPAPVPMLKIGDETPTSATEPLVDEIASCLREWHSTNLHELLLSRQYSLLDKLSKLVTRLDIARRQLMQGVLTEHELEKLRVKSVWDMVKGNTMLNNDIVVRDPKLRGRLLLESDDPIDIAKLQSTMSLLNDPPKPPKDNFNLHHLLVEPREIINERTESPKLVMYLATRKGDGPLQQLSEGFMVDVPAREQHHKAISMGKLRTLFTNLSTADIGSAIGSDASVYLVVKVQVNYIPTTEDANQAQRPTTGKDNRRNTAALPSAGSDRSAARRSILFGSRGPVKGGKGGEFAEPDEDARISAGSKLSDKPGDTTQYVKKYVGVGVIALEDLLSKTGEADHTISIWGPDRHSASAGPWHGWNKVLEETLVSPNNRWSKLEGLRKINFHLHAFASPDEQTLIRKTPTLLHNIAQTPKIGFSGAPIKPRSDIYFTISEAIIPQAASFLHPERGAVELSGASEMRNLHLTLEVRTNTGERIRGCIYPSSDSLGQTAWRSNAIRKGEKWCQTIRLDIQPEAVPYAHVIMSIAEYSEFPFALSWIPLWSNGAFLQDGEHYANLHMYDQSTSGTTLTGRGAYLDLPWDSRAREQSKVSSLAGPVASIKIQTFLCSTHSSQDQTLLRILKWREENDDQLLILLRQLVFVPEIELVKLVSDVLDALFGILVDQAGSKEFEDLTFTALVTILGIVHDRRFRLDPLVNDYAENRFDFPAAVPCLIESYVRLIGAPADYQNSRKLRAAFKVGRHIMKFIIIARKQQLRRESYTGITVGSQTTFNMDLKSVFLGFEQQMREESAAHIGSKTLIVQHMHTWLPELAPCFTHDQVLKAAASFLESCNDVDGKLILHRLVLILNVLKYALEKPSDYVPKFKERILNWIEPYWGSINHVTEQYREQVRLCCSIVAQMQGQYGTLCVPILQKTVQSYMSIVRADKPTGQTLSLLFPSSYPFPTRIFEGPRDFDENLIELAALKSTIQTDEAFRRPNYDKDEITRFVERSIDMDTSILNNEAYPNSWLTLHSFNHRSIFDRLDGIRHVLGVTGLPSPDDADEFNTEIWRKYFMLLLTLVRSPSLSLETFPEQKRRAVWKICGDIRERGADLLLLAWNDLGWETDAAERQRFGLAKLGGYQVQYVPSLVAPIMELCLSVHEGLRKAAVEVLQAMIVSEWGLNEDLSVVQTEIIECLDYLFKSKVIGDDAQQRLFIQELSDIFEPLKDTPDKALWTAIQELLRTVDHLLDLLFAVHTPDQNERLRIMHTLRLMEFLKSIQKQGIFVSYIHQLSTAEAESKNFTEAGLALRLHADVYPWDPSKMLEPIEEPRFPKQTAFERRESLFFEMIKYFEESKAWEPALACYRELAEQYETKTYDFSKLARTHRSIAKIYEQIARGHLNTPRFFRVMYRGHGFSAALRDKTFIYESITGERLSGFIDRLQQEYPSAQVSSKEEETSIEGQYIQVTSVTAHRDLDHPIWQRPKVPHSTKEFLASMNTYKFSVTTRRHSEKSLYKDQSVEKTVYSTMNTFPTILRRSEVKYQVIETLDPLDTALERTLRKIAELAILNQRAEHGDEASFQSLIDAIKSSVDPSSTSTVAQYREMLPDMTRSAIEAGTSRPEGHQVALHVALVDFASCLRQSLAKLSGPTHSQDQGVLTRQFNNAFATELAIIAPVLQLNTPFTQPPSDSARAEPRSAPPFPTTFGETITTVSAASKRQSKIGGMFKRSTMAVPPGVPLPITNGQAPPISPIPGQAPSQGSGYGSGHAPESHSPPPSSRTSTQDKRSSRVSMQSSEDTSQMATPRKGDYANARFGNPGMKQTQFAPVSQQAPAKPNQMARSGTGPGKRPGSLRRRLSNMGLGRKSSKAGVLNDAQRHPAVTEE